ncbi:MAG: sigma-54-dependent Fis family transcriptional regulator, partial [Bdellovibrionales bacterium]|nr:sigma-54-dependent Fis family transcriptional regulator [Bdellovibrionales bacterium]
LTAADGNKALEIIEQETPDIALLDVMMPNLDGIETLRSLRESHSDMPVIMLTAANTVRTAVQAMKYGAVDYLNKPFDVEELTRLIVQTLDQPQAPVHERAVASRISNSDMNVEGDFGCMVGQSPIMQTLFNKVEQVAVRDTTVLITGESGTGKELIARQIHDRSPRASGAFIAINCAAIPETLIESELFGHEKGAFTSAVEKRIGHFELADGGTLFLDEIGELSMPVQVKMLRFLQEQEFYRVGQSTPIRVDVRVIAATNKNLEELIKEKKFRQDLFYRINVINLQIPPLRERFEDIEAMAYHFVRKLSMQYGEREITFTPEALDVLRDYQWPGNVRELENVIESILALCPENVITPDILPSKLLERGAVAPVQFQVFEGNLNFEEAERRFETEMILKALKRTNYVQTRAAELLGISRRILKYKMDKLEISEEAQDSTSLSSEMGDEML